MNLYSIYDVCIEEFAPPFVAKNDKTASRMFLQAIKKMPSPDDLSLWKVGYFYPEVKLTDSVSTVEKDKHVVIGDEPVLVPIDLTGDDNE